MVKYLRSKGPVFWELKLCSEEWHSRRPHCHAEWSAGFVESGACTVGCSGRFEVVQAPALVWFAPETVHECRPDRTGDWKFRMVYWRGPGTMGDWGWEPLTGADCGTWVKFFDVLVRPDSVPETVPGWLSDRGFGRPWPTGPGPEAVHPALRPFRRPDRPYKKIHGLAPDRHRTVLQLRRAQDLLRRGYPLAEVAFETGFYDQSQFTRAFRSFTGTTPGRYKNPDFSPTP